MAQLEVKNLTKYFDLSGGPLDRWLRGTKMLKAVDHVSFSVEEGQTLGLVGESGCGKSTTARLITRLILATEGEVYFAGREILSLPRREVREIRKNIQVVFQDPYASLNPRMRVCEIVGRPLTLYYGLKGPKRTDQVAELLERVGLQADHMYRYPHEFSGGQRQRIGIARALASRPKLIIADEPVSSLDVSVQAQVLNLFKKLQRELKLTMLFISHDLNVVEYLADVVAVMYAGKIMEIAPVAEIFAHSLHPYTQGLIASNPPLESFMEKTTPRLKGEINLPVNPAPGCRLEPRCPIRAERCRNIEPALEEKRSSHRVACHEVG
ncbi:MAG: ATP-binding cassette domain-containing protein [Deltaproteobacteria bacterium]|nr:ATP-binding cassette domain-containing protein [Deltaproteobacteria bacterium]